MVAVSLKKFFFKQKTAYEIMSGDWSSDVCSSDLLGDGDSSRSRVVEGVVVRSPRSMAIFTVVVVLVDSGIQGRWSSWWCPVDESSRVRSKVATQTRSDETAPTRDNNEKQLDGHGTQAHADGGNTTMVTYARRDVR